MTRMNHRQIHFDVFVAPELHREFVDHIRSGLFHDTTRVGLETDRLQFLKTDDGTKSKPPIEYGWEPDGSGKIWHNQEEANQRIAVESIDFNFAVAKPPHDEKQPGRQFCRFSTVRSRNRQTRAWL